MAKLTVDSPAEMKDFVASQEWGFSEPLRAMVFFMRDFTNVAPGMLVSRAGYSHPRMVALLKHLDKMTALAADLEKLAERMEALDEEEL